MARQPFDMLRAAFWLLAVIMTFQMLASVGAGLACWWINLHGPREPMACQAVGVLIRELWSELITTVLALLLAGRTGNGPPSPPSNPSGDHHDE